VEQKVSGISGIFGDIIALRIYSYFNDALFIPINPIKINNQKIKIPTAIQLESFEIYTTFPHFKKYIERTTSISDLLSFQFFQLPFWSKKKLDSKYTVIF